MPTTDPVRVPIEGQDKLSPVTQKAGSALKELGANISLVGSRMTAMFTVPIVGGLALLTKSGADAQKTVNDLKTALDEAIASGDPAKIAATQKAWDDLSPSVKASAEAFGKMQAALAPANAALEEAKSKMLIGLVPVVERLSPLLVTLAEKVTAAVDWFTKLPTPVQNTILGFAGVVAVAGPLIVIIGQVTTAIGSLQAILGVAGLTTSLPTVITGLKGVLAAAAPLVAPIAAFAAVLLVADAVVKDTVGSWEEAFRRAVVAAQQLWVLANYFLGGKQAALNTLNFFDQIDGQRAAGGVVMPGKNYLVGERGPEILRMGGSMGTVIPNNRLSSSMSDGWAKKGDVYMTNNFYGKPEENANEVEAIVRKMKRNGTI